MKNIRQWGTAAGVAVILSGATALTVLPSDAAPQLRAPGRVVTRMSMNATTRTAAFVIPCPTCFLRSTPAHAHTGGTEYDGGRLTDAAGHRVGHYVVEETGMTPFNNGPGRVQLVGTLVLAGGQITFQGEEEPPLDGGAAAITGGTGRYANATGEILYSDRSATVTHLDVRLG